MSRAAQVAIAKRILELHDKDEPEYGAESWETSVDRFTNKERFELERKKFFLERPQLIAYSADIPDPDSYYTTEIAGRPIIGVDAHARDDQGSKHGREYGRGGGGGWGFGWRWAVGGGRWAVPCEW